MTIETKRSKKIGGDVMSVICDVITTFPMYGQLKAIWKLDSGRMVHKTYIFIKSNFLSYKT